MLTVSLEPRQMKITHSAVRLLLNDLQRGQAPEREILRSILREAPRRAHHARDRALDRLGVHPDRTARALLRADAAALAVVVVDLVALSRIELDDGVVGAQPVAVVAFEQFPQDRQRRASNSALDSSRPSCTSSKVDWRRIRSSWGTTSWGRPSSTTC